MGRLVSVGFSNRHLFGDTYTHTHTHVHVSTQCFFIVIALSLSLSLLSLSFGDLMERAFSMKDNSSGNGL